MSFHHLSTWVSNSELPHLKSTSRLVNLFINYHICSRMRNNFFSGWIQSFVQSNLQSKSLMYRALKILCTLNVIWYQIKKFVSYLYVMRADFHWPSNVEDYVSSKCWCVDIFLTFSSANLWLGQYFNSLSETFSTIYLHNIHRIFDSYNCSRFRFKLCKLQTQFSKLQFSMLFK